MSGVRWCLGLGIFAFSRVEPLPWPGAAHALSPSGPLLLQTSRVSQRCKKSTFFSFGSITIELQGQMKVQNILDVSLADKEMVTVTEKHKQFIQGVMFCLSWFVDMIATSSSLGSLRFAMVAGCVCWYILA